MVTLDNKDVDQTKWAPPTNSAWEHQFKIELHQVGTNWKIYCVIFLLPLISSPLSLPPPLQSREVEICVRFRDGDSNILCGLLYLRLEDFFDSSANTVCLPLEPQGILLADVGGASCHVIQKFEMLLLNFYYLFTPLGNLRDPKNREKAAKAKERQKNI